MKDLIPPSAALLPPPADLRTRLAVALREVDLLRRLIRAAESVRPYHLTTAAHLAPPVPSKQEGRRDA